MAPQDEGGAFLAGFTESTKFAHNRGTHAALTKGTVQFLPADLPASTRNKLSGNSPAATE
jgi:hypothetical protein